jgi:hypothetical protein
MPARVDRRARAVGHGGRAAAAIAVAVPACQRGAGRSAVGSDARVSGRRPPLAIRVRRRSRTAARRAAGSTDAPGWSPQHAVVADARRPARPEHGRAARRGRGALVPGHRRASCPRSTAPSERRSTPSERRRRGDGPSSAARPRCHRRPGRRSALEDGRDSCLRALADVAGAGRRRAPARLRRPRGGCGAGGAARCRSTAGVIRRGVGARPAMRRRCRRATAAGPAQGPGAGPALASEAEQVPEQEPLAAEAARGGRRIPPPRPRGGSRGGRSARPARACRWRPSCRRRRLRRRLRPSRPRSCEVDERDGVAVRTEDRHAAAVGRQRPGKGDDACCRRLHRRAVRAGDVDAAVLPGGVCVRAEGERSEHRAVRRPRPRGCLAAEG